MYFKEKINLPKSKPFNIHYKNINIMKIKELQSILKKKKIDFALFYNTDFNTFDKNMAYFSKYNGIGALVIS